MQRGCVRRSGVGGAVERIEHHSSQACISKRNQEILARASVPQLPSGMHGFRLRHLMALPLQRPGVSFAADGPSIKSSKAITAANMWVRFNKSGETG
uniref:Uncharacterized protein n=1 Tax=Aegilops tauschii subsp. strangulata TaxID=200361 RepID=A0A452Z8G4_AEGTS